MTNSGARLGSTYAGTNNNPNGQWISDIDIKSGKFYAITPTQFQFNSGNHYQFKSGSLRYSIYGGEITYAFTQPVISGGYAAGTPGTYYHNPGNMVVTVNGKKSSLTTVAGDNTAQYHVLPENKKFMMIVNNAENAVAKFIPKAVLGVAWQIAKGEAEGTLNLRLISSVDSLEYSEVRFTLVCGEKISI